MCELSCTNNTTYFASICFMSIRIHACLDMNFPLIQVVIDPASTRSVQQQLVAGLETRQVQLPMHSLLGGLLLDPWLSLKDSLDWNHQIVQLVCMQYGHDHHCTIPWYTLLSGREVLFKSILTLFLSRPMNNHLLMIRIFC